MSTQAMREVSKRFGMALALGLAFASLLAFSLPALLYAGNIAEFGTPLAQLLSPWWLPALAAAGAFAVFLALLPARLYLRLVVLASALCLLCWLQGTMMVWEYGLFDGRGIDWSVGRWRGWVDASVWIVVLLAVDAWREKLPNALPRLAILACALQAAVVGASLLGTGVKEPRHGFEAAVADLAHFSPRSNVLHILADGLQTDVAEDLLAEDHGRLARELDGFTLFEDNIGAFPYTHMAVPAMLGGHVYDNSEVLGPFLDRALGQDSIFAAARAAGYEVEVGHPGGGLIEVYKHARSARLVELPSSPTAEGWRGPRQERLLLGDLVLFRVVPHFAKPYVYNEGAWLLQGLFGNAVVPGRRFLAHVAFLRVLATKARADSVHPKYKYLHLMLSHRPMVMGPGCVYAARILDPNRENVRNQARCALQAIAGVLARMRQLGIYDNTTIVIAGDHGTFLSPDAMPPGSKAAAQAFALGLPPRLLGEARATLLVKPAHARGPLQRSRAPTWIADIPATIADVAGFPAPPEGVSAFRLKEGDARVRRYSSYEYDSSDWTQDHLSPLQEFLVRGPGDRIESWSVGRRLEAGGSKVH